MFGMLDWFWDWLHAIPVVGPYIEPVLIGGWLLHVLLLGGWIVLQKREPVATLSWILGLALLPYVGFLIYHLFGPQKIQRQRLRRVRSRIDGDALESPAFAPTEAPDARALAQGPAYRSS